MLRAFFVRIMFVMPRPKGHSISLQLCWQRDAYGITGPPGFYLVECYEYLNRVLVNSWLGLRRRAR